VCGPRTERRARGGLGRRRIGLNRVRPGHGRGLGDDKRVLLSAATARASGETGWRRRVGSAGGLLRCKRTEAKTRRGAGRLPAIGPQTKNGPERERLRKKRIENLNNFEKSTSRRIQT
jgi:hypothetical protein